MDGPDTEDPLQVGLKRHHLLWLEVMRFLNTSKQFKIFQLFRTLSYLGVVHIVPVSIKPPKMDLNHFSTILPDWKYLLE